jgi:hypothetical protein
LGNLKEEDVLGDLDASGKIIIKWIFKGWDGEEGTGFIWLRIVTGGTLF